MFAWVVQQTGTGRNAILTVGLFFIVGAIVLTFVDVEAGRRVARAAEAEAAAAG